MKKLLTKNQRAKKDKTNQIILGVLLIGLMLFSTLGYALGGKDTEDSQEVIEYNGIEFSRNSDYWTFNYNNQEHNTRYNPNETKEIQVPIKMSLQDYSQKPLYIVGEIAEPTQEILRILKPLISRVNMACLPNTNCTIDAPTKDPAIDNIIIIQEPTKNQTENIVQQDKAIFITASFENQTKYTDAFVFKLLGI